MKLYILGLITAAALGTAATAYAVEDGGGGGGSEQIICITPAVQPHWDAFPNHWYYTRSQTWGGHC